MALHILAPLVVRISANRMMPRSRWSVRRMPGLLVSVRNATEAREALLGGADVIDVKEPSRGPLGRPDAEIVAEIVRLVGKSRPVTAAAGDWGELSPDTLDCWADKSSAAVTKVGIPSEEALRCFWAEVGRNSQHDIRSAKLAPVIYADKISPESAMTLLPSFADGWLVVDTCNKNQGDLLDAWTPDKISKFLKLTNRTGLRVTLAGGLRGESLETAISLSPQLVGVRGAVCQEGREGRLCGALLGEVNRLLRPFSNLCGG